MKNTAGWPRGRGVQPRRAIPTIQKESPFEDSRRLIIFVLPMYKQLTSEQRSQIFALLQRKCPRKEIALIVGISQSTLSRELRRNSARSASTFGSRRTTRRWNVASVPHAMLPLLPNWCGESNNSSSKNSGHRDKYRAC